MPNAKLSIIHHRAPVYQSLLDHHQIVGRNVLVTANVPIKWHVLIANVEIHVQVLVVRWLSVMLLIMYRLARVKSIIQAIRLFSA